MVQCLKQQSKTTFLTSAITGTNSCTSGGCIKNSIFGHLPYIHAHCHGVKPYWFHGAGAHILQNAGDSTATGLVFGAWQNEKKNFVREIARLISLNDRVKKIIFLIQTLLKRSFLNSVSNSVSDSFYILLCSAGSCLLALRNDSSALLGRWLLWSGQKIL